ncbi:MULTISPECIES: AtpZ/AtpI family protein [Priestia]|jgi:F0F1-type ATP synthase assembly protein I|uniref:Uncharacterized protein n=3 Tax=Priestia TaxID=2800373 RepID=A0A0H4L380_9BACI|nr:MULTISPECIES: AtpZ/AtpI family protein [Priestia]AKO95208.1 hypothetical protein BEH_23420 [Priestia filamentosa]KAB2490663.1 AtpZ/AtpI family protein [Priestia endophytica]KYG28714.1 hypothetical protein AZF06_11380 [Priestia endophytica]MBG9810799.1 membrane protein [Priestia endophytica]MCM3540315.1 AtpZ/AtpI family protein [Priestia endophytica]
MKDGPHQLLKAMSLMTTIVSQLAGFPLIGMFVGGFLDRKFGTDPLWLIVGILLGIALGIYVMLYSIKYFFSGD